VRLFILFSFVASCGLSAALGARLLAAGLRTRTAPELAYGASLLLSGLAGVVRLVVHGFLGAGPEYHAWIVFAAVLRMATLMALSWGIRSIFRAQDAWSIPLVGAFWLLGAGGLAIVWASPGGLAEAGLVYTLGDAANGLAVLWGCLESFAHYGRMKRRLALGLADPVTVQQFKTFGISFTFAVMASATLLAGTAALGSAITSAPAIMAAVQVGMLGTAICTWLAFYPPKALRDLAASKQSRSQPDAA